MLIPDPSNPQDWNRFGYVRNNPIRFNDPTGHCLDPISGTLCIIGGILIAIAVDLAVINQSNQSITSLENSPDLYPQQVEAKNWVDQCIGQCHYSDSIDPIPGYTIGGERPTTPISDAYAEAHIARNIAYADLALNVIALGGIAVTTSRVSMPQPYSFSENTVVETDEGKKDISEIVVGDYVLAWDEEKGEIGYYEVTDTFSHLDAVLTNLVIDGEWIETTPEHPFYTLEEGWVPANELKPGMHIWQADSGYELIWLKWSVHETQEMYNLTVAEAHTYFVGEGQWLVHNSCLPSTKEELIAESTLYSKKGPVYR